jgi:alkylhydroperoxidase family enzyme
MTRTSFTRTGRDALPKEFQPAWDTMYRLTGEPTFIEVFAQAPELLSFVMDAFYTKVFFGGCVESRYKQLARLRLSVVHGCRTCNKQNVPGALAAGIGQDQVDAIFAGTHADGPFTDADKAVLAYADQLVLTNMQGDLSPALYAQLRRHFSEPQILELGVAMAVIAGMAKLSFVLGLVEKEDYCPFTPAGHSPPKFMPTSIP